ncbi:MAG TPA: F0F1 ATP synthase subunit alpha, partial [Candidatus Caccosoma faecigallinarum]|nr:F0F1 ATP synthase subunit alpha [Candidatus Caccosoma faecigallinarum]
AYIPTNVISITDGQIFLQTELFNEGQRPAIDTGLSVSRVGSNAQIKAIKQVSGTLKIELANYRELQAFAQFGSDLDKNTKEILEHGKKVMELLKQPQYAPMDVYDQIMVLFSAKHRFIKKVPLVRIKEYQVELLKWLHQHHENLFEDLKKMNALDETLENTLKNVMMQFTDEFINI